MKFYYVYVLQSGVDTGLYIGFTRDLRRRLAQHQEGESPSTRGRRPWELVYYEAYRMIQDAEGREKFLKSGAGRKFLEKQLKCHFQQHSNRST